MHSSERGRQLELLQQRVIACRRCPRLASYIREVAEKKRRMHREQEYWGKPLPSFGDPKAELLVVGLAPAAHGGNRTGRMFTGDRSGDFLYRALYEAGFASQPVSRDRYDGLKLGRCYVTAALRCAPPENKPLPQELRNCQPYLEQEFQLLPRLRAVLALGRVAFDACRRVVFSGNAAGRTAEAEAARRPGRRSAVAGNAEQTKLPPLSSLRFAHGASYELPGYPRLFACYHPSQQNTQTGKLTVDMMRTVLEGVRRYLQGA
jgi:uracil-DNA glycosylase